MTDFTRQLITKMNVKCLTFAVVMVVKCVMTEAEFSPVKWSPSLSEQCGEHGHTDLSGVLTTLTEMIVNNKAPSFLPKSCMEIKESSPVSPSGYYTISNGSSESGVVVYCNMDDLSSCPALEQTLSGIKKDMDSFFTHINSLALEQMLNGIKKMWTHCSLIMTAWPWNSHSVELRRMWTHCSLTMIA